MRYFTFIFLLTCTTLQAQLDMGLITSFSFDGIGCPAQDANPNSTIVALPPFDSECLCGLNGGALKYNGDRLQIIGGGIEETMRTVNFTLSFYFKPILSSSAEPQILFSKKETCQSDSSLTISFVPGNERLIVDMVENPTQSASLFYDLDGESCWYHVALARNDRNTILYINGEEVKRTLAILEQRVNISNTGTFSFGGSDCVDDASFDGLIDEIYLYNRALERDEIEDLYIAPDKIDESLNALGVKEAVVRLGESYQVMLNATCATDFAWFPSDNLSNDMVAEPTIIPTETTTYAVTMSDTLFCIAEDSILITVVDPSTIDCNDILLPSAFTPNGDGLNDDFGISNPFATGVLKNFEIYDRWGNIVFRGPDVYARWDGTYRGDEVNPGVFLYKLHLTCQGEEIVRSGSVTVIR